MTVHKAVDVILSMDLWLFLVLSLVYVAATSFVSGFVGGFWRKRDEISEYTVKYLKEGRFIVSFNGEAKPENIRRCEEIARRLAGTGGDELAGS